MADISFAPEAEEDISGIAEYIAQDKPEAANRWIQNLQDTCQLLATQPEMGEKRSDLGITDCRSFSVGSYVIFFRRVTNGIEVARVFHGSRDVREL